MFNPKEYTCEHCSKKFIREGREGRSRIVRYCSKVCVGRASKKHGLSESKFYRKFRSLKQRCEVESDKSYKNYGGRGIKCEWDDFESFYSDMYKSYIKHVQKHTNKHTHLDRIDNNGNYSKDNCRWVTPKENSYNRSNTVTHEIDGRVFHLKELAEKYKIKLSTIKTRFYVLGWDINKACKTPVR